MEFSSRVFYTLTQADVHKPWIKSAGRTWLACNFIGRILPGDVGKRVYFSNGIAQVENDAQRDARLKVCE